MNGQYSKKNILGQLAIVLHAHLPYVRKNEKNSLEEDWLFQAILECYIPLLQSIESSKNENPLNTGDKVEAIETKAPCIFKVNCSNCF